MTYNKMNKTVILGSTWDKCLMVYDAASNNWVKTTSFPFPNSTMEMMDYDDENSNIIVSTYNYEMYFYNICQDKWTSIGWPSWADSEYAFSYDRTSNEIVFFGGHYAQGQFDPTFNDVWVYNLKRYESSGIFTSEPYDTGGTAFFGELRWSAVLPASTNIQFQLRTANSQELLNSTPFIGPDGINSSFYAVSGQKICVIHNGTHWLQYRAYLSTSDTLSSPTLKNVTIDFNLLQNITITSPSGSENWTGLQTISWNATDPDNDTLMFDIYLVNSSNETMALATNLTGELWSWNTSKIANGSYRIQVVARDDNPSIPLSTASTSGDFTIHHPIPPPSPNHPPNVSLVLPLNNSLTNTTSTRLQWSGSDPDGDPLTYTVHYSDLPFSKGTILTQTTTSEFLDLANRLDNTTYYWTVSASDGKSNGTDIPTEIWSFTVRLPPANIPVRFTSTPDITAWVGIEYTYNLTSLDEDGDIPIFSIVSAPSNVTLDSSTGKLHWTPTTSDIGNHTITVQVSDGRGSFDNQTFTITVKETIIPPVFPPKCAITYPANGTTVKGTIKVLGTASNGSLALSIVKIRIDNGTWKTAIGLDNWNFTLDTAKLAKGNHRIEAKSIAANLSSETASVDFTVSNPEPGASIGGNERCLAIIGAGLVAGIAVLIIIRKRVNRWAG